MANYENIIAFLTGLLLIFAGIGSLRVIPLDASLLHAFAYVLFLVGLITMSAAIVSTIKGGIDGA